MKKTLLGLAFLLLLPTNASAATVDADVKRRNGVNLGPVTFTAAKGEVNRLTARDTPAGLQFHDSANPVKAKGDCERIDRHTAVCPQSEDGADADLGNRDDTANVESERVEVSGGAGDDVLRGGSGRQTMNGDGGNDTLHGRGHGDILSGGPGRDRVFGGGADDTLIDGETDGQSAPDLYRGGSSRDTRLGADRGDTIDYGLRKRSVRIDLGRGKSNTGDRILGLESVVGGSGGDRLAGDGDDNYLEGKGGADVLKGRGGRDIPLSGPGNDTADGGDGDDVVWGDSGYDKLSGGDGNDSIQTRPREDRGEEVRCGRGRDDVSSGRDDVLRDCEVAHSLQYHVEVHPAISGDTATFRIACQHIGGCDGTISIASLTGADYGSGSFNDLPDDPQTFNDVAVKLTSAGQAALADGELVEVRFGGTGGYRAVLSP